MSCKDSKCWQRAATHLTSESSRGITVSLKCCKETELLFFWKLDFFCFHKQAVTGRFYIKTDSIYKEMHVPGIGNRLACLFGIASRAGK